MVSAYRLVLDVEPDAEGSIELVTFDDNGRPLRAAGGPRTKRDPPAGSLVAQSTG